MAQQLKACFENILLSPTAKTKCLSMQEAVPALETC